MNNNEKNCYTCGTPITKAYCEDFPEVCEHWTQKKPQTNYDRIKAMSIEEMAVWLHNMTSTYFCDEYCPMRNSDDVNCCDDCDAAHKKWLESEVQEE